MPHKEAEVRKAYVHKWYIRNRDAIIAKVGSRRDSPTLRLKIIEILGGKCIRCGFDDWRALQIDHILGNGRSAQTKAKTLWQYYKQIYNEVVNGSQDYQVLCANHNWIKRAENKEHGHGRKRSEN